MIIRLLLLVLWLLTLCLAASPLAHATEPLPVPPYYTSNAKIKALYDTHVAQTAEIDQLRAQLAAAAPTEAQAEILARLEAIRAALPLVLTISGGGGSFTLSWLDNSSNETGFKIERAVQGGAWVQIATVAANVTTYRDAGLQAGSYSYRLRAYNAAGNSGYSNTATGSL